MHKGLYNWELVRTQFKTLKLNCRGSYTFLRLGGSPKLIRFSSSSVRAQLLPKLRRPGLAPSRRLYWPVSRGSALIRQASLGPSRAAPVFPSGAAGSSGPCVPIAFALGPLAVHRWLSHPKSARCFAPVTTGCGSLRNTRANIARVRHIKVALRIPPVITSDSRSGNCPIRSRRM